ncbi:1-acyl-sn-glycerol-3-phosphate acyltransferase 2 [Hibiscus syriacus]|uniref:1-acylglycerol-3-phosphate O-acyltransferase n=1 Tax=Hibiscus syriacus TaxID=106335 RepID=A0A6A3D175_HIBSY|nr:1-acyl-sn-glycerol-3-phosphate acyltransferase 2 [Hibiscus syriacus]
MKSPDYVAGYIYLYTAGLQQLRDFPQPFWLALFVEGTRFTQAKLVAAQEYATSQGLSRLRNILIPRTKPLSFWPCKFASFAHVPCLASLSYDSTVTYVPGPSSELIMFAGFVSAVSHMRSFVPAIYDVTVAIPKSSPSPTMLRLFKGESSVVHVHIKRHLMKELPETDEAIAQWCKDLFVEKDKLLDKHIADDTFSDQPLQDIGRPIKSLLVVSSWACIMAFGALRFLRLSSLFSSWKGIALSAIGLAVITVLMQIMIRFSQSERSTTARAAAGKLKEGESSVARREKQQ